MFRQLKNNLVILFGISSAEARGVIIIYSIIAVILTGSFFVPRFFSDHYDAYLPDERKLDSLVKIIESDTLRNESSIKKTNAVHKHLFFSFDPNSIGKKELDSMGFPGFISERMIKYRNAGGRFQVRNDIKKIYGLNDDFYQKIKPYLLLPDEVSVNKNNRIADKAIKQNDPVPDQFDLNTVDSVVLINLKGIGPVLAGRIIKYRSLLGGYVSKDQLKEVFGIKDTVLLRLKAACYIEPEFKASQIKVNFAEWKDLARHPYIGKNNARLLLKYRDSRGPFHSIDDLGNVKNFNDSLISKLEYYIEF
jgi:competence protein ComEA